MAEWLRDAYLELTETKPLDFENLRPVVEPHSTNALDRDWEADAKKWEASSRDWETIARVFCLQMKVAAFITSFSDRRYHCDECRMDYGRSESFTSAKACLCRCRLLALVDEAFRGELESFPGYVELPLRCELLVL